MYHFLLLSPVNPFNQGPRRRREVSVLPPIPVVEGNDGCEGNPLRPLPNIFRGSPLLEGVTGGRPETREGQ